MADAPPLDPLPYEESSPVVLWQECIRFKERWENESACSEKMRGYMDYFRNQRAISLVWMSNMLEGTLPKGASEMDTHRLLMKLLSEHETDTDHLDDKEADIASGLNSDDRKSRQQMIKHMKAYQTLCEKNDRLTVDLIKKTHKILMEGLMNDGKPVTAGSFRTTPVYADNHQFPSPKCVPSKMDEIVTEYNKRYSDNHDPYQLASWLLFKVISLHPFEDGNGRLCRLLWCFSLMRDGLPFPSILTSGHRKAYQHYIQALTKSRRPTSSHHGHLTSLTVLSVYLAWNNFFFNWDNFEK